MITGYNTDIEYDGRVYHVQTEDRGRGNPIVESLVYCGGEILTSEKTPYRELMDDPDFDEDVLQKRMEDQHHRMIREIRNGTYDPDGPKPFGYNIISNRSLDEVIAEYLTNDVGVDHIRVEIEEHTALYEGQTPTVRIRVLGDDAEVPIAGATVQVKMISTSSKPQVVFEGETGEDGRCAAEFEIPPLSDADGAILIQAAALGTHAEAKQLVRKNEDQ